jgi:hypothetical protein
MNRSDILGVDFFPVPLSSELKPKQNFDLNNQILKVSYEDHMNLQLDDSLTFVKGQGKGRAYLAQHDTKVDEKTGETIYNKVRYSIPAWKVIEKGEIESIQDFTVIKAMGHEIGHAARGEAIYREHKKSRHGYEDSSASIEEGSNEIAAWRFAFHSIQMPKQVRNELRANPDYVYEWECRKVADLALLVNEGDEKTKRTHAFKSLHKRL